MTNCIGAPDEQLEEKELRIAELEEKVETLERENFRIKNDTRTVRPSDESDKIIKDLSRQNAMLRRKLDDALEKIGK